MGAGQLAAVADTGPLIHLAEIDALDLLSIFTELHIPGAVWRGAERPTTIRVTLRSIAHRHSVDPQELDEFTDRENLERLQAGERECLCLGSKLRVPILLTDDLAVRTAARSLALTPVGSLGIVAKACLAGRIGRTEAERYLVRLYEVSSLFVTRTIVDLAVERLRKTTGPSSPARE